jgi:hypothetical protein
VSRELLGIEWDVPRVLLAALVVATLLGLVVAASTSSAAFGLYNPNFEGTSELRSVADEADTETTVIQNTSGYRTADPGTVALVLAPDRGYTERELASMRGYLNRGGTLVVAEDVGTTGNDLLDGLGASARVNGTLLRDERHNYQSPALPVARNVTDNQTLTRGVGSLTLNYGSTVEPGDGNVTVLVRSSEFAYLDRNGNAELDENERLDSRPVATVEPVGQGRVVVVSDPSVFINAMLERSGNRRFARNLAGEGDRLLLDFSHTADLPPLALALVTVRNVPLLQTLVGGLAVGLVGAWGVGLFGRFGGLVGRLRRDRAATEGPPVSEADLVAYLQSEHPDWDPERVRRIAQGLSTERGEDGRDD